MARTSRKAAVIETEPALPEKVYHAAIYVRLSVEDNKRTGDGESIAMQQYMLEKYVAQQPDMMLYGVYSDNGESGTGFARPGFEHMMDGVRKREIDCIIVKDLSRFGRNYVETGYYLEKIFPYLGVRFVAVNDHYDTENEKEGNESCNFPEKSGERLVCKRYFTKNPFFSFHETQKRGISWSLSAIWVFEIARR